MPLLYFDGNCPLDIWFLFLSPTAGFPSPPSSQLLFLCYNTPMFIDANLDNYSYTSDPDPCNTCFNINKTPETMYLCFSDIKIGALWTPADPPPPFGAFEITHQGFCIWEGSDANYAYQFATVPDFSDVIIHTPGFDTIFWQRHVGICFNWWVNAISVPAGNKWYGGYCLLLNTLPDGIAGISDILELMSDSPDWADFLRPGAMATQTGTYLLYKRQDNTTIKIKIDHS